jgi:hypothetical protein
MGEAAPAHRAASATSISVGFTVISQAITFTSSAPTGTTLGGATYAPTATRSSSQIHARWYRRCFS